MVRDRLIDDMERPTASGTAWRLVSDRVMGGVSDGALAVEDVAGRRAIRMTGQVRLENDGGFVQMARDLAPDGGSIDASAWRGIELTVRGNGEDYNLHLRTADVRRPWQSYRAEFAAPPAWTTHRLTFAGFAPHRIDAPLDLTRLRRIGLVAIGRAFHADLAFSRIAFY